MDCPIDDKGEAAESRPHEVEVSALSALHVTDGIVSAMTQAKRAASDRNVLFTARS